MSSVKQFYRPRIASRAYWPRQLDRRAIIYRPFDDSRLPLAVSAPRKRPSAFRKGMARAGARVSYLAGHAFPNLLLVAGSWVVAEVLAGCATYAEAMYCIPPEVTDGRCAPPEVLPRNAPAGRRPDLFVVLGDGRPQTAREGGDCASHPERPSANAAGWHVAIAAPMVRLMAKWQRAQSRRRALAELRALDDRSLRDIGLTRADIEYAARHRIYLG
jgi:uncharacterized protein YjiS (DUF1127 family)